MARSRSSIVLLVPLVLMLLPSTVIVEGGIHTNDDGCDGAAVFATTGGNVDWNGIILNFGSSRLQE